MTTRCLPACRVVDEAATGCLPDQGAGDLVSGGKRHYFSGSMSMADLRIYAFPLAAEEVAALCRLARDINHGH